MSRADGDLLSPSTTGTLGPGPGAFTGPHHAAAAGKARDRRTVEFKVIIVLISSINIE